MIANEVNLFLECRAFIGQLGKFQLNYIVRIWHKVLLTTKTATSLATRRPNVRILRLLLPQFWIQDVADSITK